MKRTDPRAESKMSRVFAAVCPTKPVLNSEAETCTTSAEGSTPSASKSCPMRRATVVLPVPGAPWKQKVRARSSIGSRPARAAASTTAWYSARRVRMASQPTRPSSASAGSAMCAFSTTKSESSSSVCSARSAGGSACRRLSARSVAVETQLSTVPALPKLGRMRAFARSRRTTCLAAAKETRLPRRATLPRRMRSSAWSS
mmetsp:Transcript_21417/g.50789  ORF Transcript_21417/g.50789 Transcript_21417/m.50789 type:complete len:201 (+) Transcript_21417:765-1367(+)